MRVKPNVYTGCIDTLLSGRMKTWKGWAVYYWDMGHCVTLFKKKPEFDSDNLLEYTQPRTEKVQPDFLRACGITFEFDGKDEHELYYGEGRRSYALPVQITLNLPEALIDLMDLP